MLAGLARGARSANSLHR